jgi:hypothetical protein
MAIFKIDGGAKVKQIISRVHPYCDYYQSCLSFPAYACPWRLSGIQKQK